MEYFKFLILNTMTKPKLQNKEEIKKEFIKILGKNKAERLFKSLEYDFEHIRFLEFKDGTKSEQESDLEYLKKGYIRQSLLLLSDNYKNKCLFSSFCC